MKKRLPLRRRIDVAACALLATLWSSSEVSSQCQLDWQPGQPLAGPSGRVTALNNLPGGDLIAAGWFLEAGQVVANRIARWDGVRWHALGSGLNDVVQDLVVAPNGDVYVGGLFTTAGGAPAGHIARWDGSSWSQVGQGFDGIVQCLELLPNGHLLAGGSFQNSGSTSTRLLAEWDGSTWSQVGSGLTGSTVRSMDVLPGGGIVVCGGINAAGGTPVSNVAVYDSASWSGIPGLQVFSATSVAAASNGDVAISGVFAQSNQPVVLWDGTAIQPIAGSATPNGPDANSLLQYLSNGELVALRQSAAGTNGQGWVTRWDGTSWQLIGSEIDVAPFALVERPSGDLMVGGGRNAELSASARSLKSFDGAEWSDFGPRRSTVTAFAEGPFGELYATGPSDDPTGSAIRRWTGTQWQPAGPPVQGVGNSVAALANGGLVASGVFPTATPGVDDWVLRGDGLQWMSISAGLPAPPDYLAAAPDGTLFAAVNAAGAQAVMSFDGSQWNDVGSGVSGRAWKLSFLPNGDLLAIGNLSVASGPVFSCMRWDGSTWSGFGSATGLVALTGAVLPSGEVAISVGDLTSGFRVTVSSGGTWTQVGEVFDRGILDLRLMPNGDLLAAGEFEQLGGVAIARLARWDGSSWSALETPGDANGSVLSVGLTGSGELHLAGGFTRLGNLPSVSVGRAVTSCAADVMAYGSGCIGPAGPVVLAALDSPWVGSSYRVRAYGMPQASVAVHAVGLTSASVALSPLLPQSLPGCQLLTSAEILGLALPAGGVAEPALQLPNEVSLAGAQFYQQVLAVQIGSFGLLQSVSSSNGLMATVGSF